MTSNNIPGPSSSGFTCPTCGKHHPGLPLDWAFNAPIYWDQIPEAERSQKGRLTPDFCSIEDRDFFVRGIIPVPILGSDELFMWGVWVSLSREHFFRMTELWHDPKIVQEPPYFGWLANNIPIYPNTLNLKTNISSKNVKHRPHIELEPTDHPLSLEQRTGITRDRVEEIAALMMHQGPTN